MAARVAGRPRATPRPSTTSPRCAGWSSTRPGCCRTPTPAPCSPDELAALRPGRGQPGDDARVARRAARRARRPPRPLPDKTAGAPAGHARGGRASSAIPFTTGILVGIGETRAERLEALAAIAGRPPPPRPRAGGDRPELPAQAGHGDARRRRRARPTSSSGRSPPPGSCCRPSPPAGAAEPHRRPRRRCSRPASTTGAASRRHRRPREPRAPVARARPAARGHRGRRASCSPRGSRSTPSSSADPARWLDPDLRFAGAGPLRRRGPGPRRPPGSPGDAEHAAARCSTGARVPAPGRRPRSGEVLAGVLGRAGGRASDEIVDAVRGQRAARSRAVAEVADELRRQTVGDVVTFVRNRNINYTNVCTFKCRFCAFSKGPLSLNLRGAPYLLDARRDAPAGRRGRRARRHRGRASRAASTPTSTATTTSTSPRPCTRPSPDIHVHGFTALEVTEGARRLGEPLARLPAPAQGRRPGQRCPAPPPRSSTTRSGRSSAPTR